MSCCGEREKGAPEKTARWEFINLSDFKNSSPTTVLAFAWLWFMALVSVAVYAVDTFTAVNLLAFNNWSSQIQPELPLKYSKWIFSMCIVASWVLCIFEWIRAVRIIRRGGVAESYMDPLAVSLQSMRPQGWKRFLVFKALTNSKKRIDYTALFVYFAFKGAIRVVVAEGPRQVVNGMTLVSVWQAQFGHGTSQSSNPFIQFFLNIKTLAEEDDRQAIILASMLFTLVVWVFSALSLIAATVLYLLFLWHYIPKRDGRLSVYCRRKIDKRLEKIVEHKIKAAIEEENRKMEKAERKAEAKRLKTGELPPAIPSKLIRQPTLPQLDTDDAKIGDALASDQKLSRQNTSGSLSTISSNSFRPQMSHSALRQPTLPDIEELSPHPGMLNRTGTSGSAWSNATYQSDAPLLSNAGHAGGDEIQSPAATFHSRQTSIASTQRSMGPRRVPTNGSQMSQGYMDPIHRTDSPASTGYPPRSFTPRSQGSNPYPNGSSTWPEQGPGRASPAFFIAGAQSTESPQDMSPRDGPFARSQSRHNLPDRSNPTPAPPGGVADGEAPYGKLHGRQRSFSRPFDRNTSMSRTPALGMDRRPTMETGLHSQQSSFSRPMPQRKQTSTSQNYQHPFAPPTEPLDRDQPASRQNSYEMTVQPSYSKPLPTLNAPNGNTNSQYVAYNPSKSPSPPMPSNTNTNTNPFSSRPGQAKIEISGRPGQEGSYFGHVETTMTREQPPQRNFTAPASSSSSQLAPPSSNENRLTTGYNDILDDYGGFAPEHEEGWGQQSSQGQQSRQNQQQNQYRENAASFAAARGYGVRPASPFNRV